MCDTGPVRRPFGRRALLGAALAGTGLAVAGCSTRRDAPATLPLDSSQPTGDALTLLGTSGGPQAEYGRTGTSTALTVGGRNYVVDAGRSSVTQYLNAGLKFASLGGMFITHLHSDHLADYYNYFMLEGGEPNEEKDNLAGPLTVYGPGPAGGLPPEPTPPVPTIAPADPTPGIKALTERLNEGYAYSYNVFMRGTGTRDVRNLQDIHEIAIPDVGAGPTNTAPPMQPFPIFEDDRVRVSAILVPHGRVFPAFAFRFDTDSGAVAFSGDTTASDNVVRIAQGADVLVHSVLDLDAVKLSGRASPELLTHLEDSQATTSQVGPIAERAGVKTLVLTHLVPSNPRLIPNAVWHAQCSVGFGGTVHVGNDLDRIALPVRRP